MNKLNKIALVSIVIVYLVILAGGIVRMTGSGMGCPDWPKCFGFLIPPTERSQLDWKPNYNYNKNQIIIIDEKLFFANEKFKSSNKINKIRWSRYTKHNYSKFDVFHTWIEYINRLIGAVAGISVLYLFLYSLRFLKTKRIITILCFISLIAILFQAWLGKTVVDSNLSASNITIHMLMAILLLFFLFSILTMTNTKRKFPRISKSISGLVFVSLLLLSVQIFTGTEVRKFVDIKMEMYNYTSKNKWIENISYIFSFHRSFSWLIIIVNSIIFFKLKKIRMKSVLVYTINLLIFVQILSGIVMYYFDFPFTSQPIHLLISSMIIGLQFYFLLLYNLKSNAIKI